MAAHQFAGIRRAGFDMHGPFVAFGSIDAVFEGEARRHPLALALDVSDRIYQRPDGSLLRPMRVVGAGVELLIQVPLRGTSFHLNHTGLRIEGKLWDLDIRIGAAGRQVAIPLSVRAVLTPPLRSTPIEHRSMTGAPENQGRGQPRTAIERAERACLGPFRSPADVRVARIEINRLLHPDAAGTTDFLSTLARLNAVLDRAKRQL